MAFGIQVRLTATGASRSNILIDDIRDDTSGSGRRGLPPEYVYLPAPTTAVPNPQITLTYGGLVPMSFERGDIRGYINRGLITAEFLIGGQFQLGTDGVVTIISSAAAPSPDTYTGGNDDTYYLVDTTLDAVTITIPAGGDQLRGRFYIVDLAGNASVNPITVVAAAGDTIDGDASYTLATDHGQVEFVWDEDSDWFIPVGVGSSPPGGPAGGGLTGFYPNPTVVPTAGLDTTADRLKAQTITVAKGGGDYFTIEAALAAAGLVATTNNRIVVEVYPGDYTENNPLTVPDFVTINCLGRHEVTRMLCANSGAGDHGFVCGSNSEILGIEVAGASGAGAAGYYIPDTTHDLMFHDTKVRNCSIGWWSLASGSSPGIIARESCVTEGTCLSIFRASNGGLLTVENALVLDDVIRTQTFHVDGAGSRMRLQSSRANGAGAGRSVFVENGGDLDISSSAFYGPDKGIEIDATGGTVQAQACIIEAVTFDLVLADDPDVVCALRACSFNSAKLSIGAQAQLSGFGQDLNPLTPGPTVIGELRLGVVVGERVPLTTYTRSTAATAHVDGGLVTINAGLTLDVASGSGFINTGTGVLYVQWLAQQVVAADESDFHVYIDSTGTAQISGIEPSFDSVVILATGRTDAGAVAMLARRIVPAQFLRVRRHEWIAQVVGSTWLSGLAVSEVGGPSLQFEMDGGTFYQTDVLLTALASASPCVFNYWYRDGAGWDVTVGANALDDANYDPAGAGLGAIPVGEWVKCAVYVNANDGTTQWHVVYAQTSYASQLLAEAATLAVPPGVFDENALPVAAFVYQEGSGDITDILDIRPRIVTAGPGSAPAPATHGALAGLAADDHTGYMRLAGDAARNPLTGTLNAAGGSLVLPVSAAPAQTTEGSVVWNSTADVLTVGTGASRVTLVGTTTAQTLAAKTIEKPVIPDYIDFTPGAEPAYVEGRVFYDSTDKALSCHVSDGSTLQIGQETFIRVRNITGVQIDFGSVVYVNGASNNRPTIALAFATSEAESTSTIGLATSDIANGTEGLVTILGVLRGLDTTGGVEAWVAGDRVFLSATTPGGLTNVPPVSPLHRVRVGWVLNADPVVGILLIRPFDSSEIPELDDVLLAGLANGHVLTYDLASTVWKNAAPAIANFGAIANPAHDHSDVSNGGVIVQATEVLRGGAEIATQVETNTGTNDTNFITPLKLASATTVIKTGQTAGGSLGGTYPNPTVTPAAGLDSTAIHSGDAAGGDLAGTYPNPTARQSSTAFALTGVITPVALVANQNNYNPTGLSGASTIRQAASSNVNITGLAGGASGRLIVITNISAANTLTLENESGLSTAANRFTLPGSNNITLAVGDTAIFQYNATTTRWFLIASSKGNTTAGQPKSRFSPFGANAATARGQHNTVSVGANSDINIEFQIPDDFTALISVQAVMIPGATNAAADIDLSSTYGAIGEAFNIHAETNVVITYNLTINQITGLDLSSVFTSLAVGDFCGINLKQNGIGATSNYLGILLRYT